MKKLLVLLFALAYISTAYGASLAKTVGFYHWGGRHITSMSEGVERIGNIGGHVARVVLAPTYYTNYNVGQGCYPGYSLSALAHEPDVMRALDHPSIEVFMLTAYDGVSFGDCIRKLYLQPPFYTPGNTAALVQEYSDFTLYLYESFQHTHKRFIISDWEGDNAVYCNAALDYATKSTFRAQCDADYPAHYGNQSPAESMQGLKLWHQARQQGIADGRRRAAAAGIGGMRVYYAPEFSITRALHNNGFASVLYDVLPGVIFDYVSYSAYESINQPDARTILTADLNTIQDVTGSIAIIIGEAGFSRSAWRNVTARTADVIDAAMAWGVEYFIQWNLYDVNEQSDFGLFDVNGNATPLEGFFLGTINNTGIRPAVRPF